MFLAYAVPGGGRALIDRELYLPRVVDRWTGTGAGQGIGDDVAFATKPELARQMIERAIDGGGAVRVGRRRRGIRAGHRAAGLAGGTGRELRAGCAEELPGGDRRGPGAR